MDCSKINEYLMGYMDKTLTEKEIRLLNEHISVCPSCKQDFIIYNEMIKEFEGMQMISAPDNFESIVMERIRALPETFNASQKIDNLLCTVLGIFSVLFGMGLLLTLNRDKIFEYFSANEYLHSYLNMLQPVSEKVDAFVAAFMVNVSAFSNFAALYLPSSRYVVLLALLVLGAVQFFIYRKSKVEV